MPAHRVTASSGSDQWAGRPRRPGAPMGGVPPQPGPAADTDVVASTCSLTNFTPGGPPHRGRYRNGPGPGRRPGSRPAARRSRTPGRQRPGGSRRWSGTPGSRSRAEAVPFPLGRVRTRRSHLRRHVSGPSRPPLAADLSPSRAGRGGGGGAGPFPRGRRRRAQSVPRTDGTTTAQRTEGPTGGRVCALRVPRHCAGPRL